MIAQEWQAYAGFSCERIGSGSWGEGAAKPSATTRGLSLEERMAQRRRASTEPSRLTLLREVP